MHIHEFAGQLNEWGRDRIPFLFMVDFEMEKPMAFRMSDVDERQILFRINGVTNAGQPKVSDPFNSGMLIESKQPLPFYEYKAKFDAVSRCLHYGDSYLTNLTVKTEVRLSITLRELFFLSQARYKLYFNDQFLVFSPETFVRIQDGKIISCPMKGTIDAAVPDAASKILNDKKELAEHITIVDLIRNDLSQVATNVKVTRFRYLDALKTDHKNLLQVSSEITGMLPGDYPSMIGDIIVKLLPAGSVSGAPKPKTVAIIREAEQEKRGYYTGVFGYFDGRQMDSGVMIRYVERDGDKMFYRSGGGITTQSIASAEYQEVIDKVYVPLD